MNLSAAGTVSPSVLRCRILAPYVPLRTKCSESVPAADRSMEPLLIRLKAPCNHPTIAKSRRHAAVESIWKHNFELQEREPLPGNMEAETVVIGAGMAGILIAYFLQKKGRQVIVVEADRIGSGQTQNTTAKITGQHGMCYEKLIKQAGRNRARSYARANIEAVRMYEKIIQEEGICCHFEARNAYLYTMYEEGRKALQTEVEAATSLGIDACFLDAEEITELPFPIQGAVCFEHQAQFHPLEFIGALANDLQIYENTKVLSVKEHTVFTNRGSIQAENIVFATHYPIINLPGFYFLRQHQERSYVLALKDQKELSGMYYNIDDDVLSLRSVGSTLLLGGGAHRTGKDKNKGKDRKKEELGYAYLRRMARTYYPKAEEVAFWSAQDCMPHDKIPFIGRYSAFRPYWYVATGFQKWGMTSSMIAAIIISNQICGIPDPYEYVFTPQRFLLRASVKNLLTDIGESVCGLIKGLFSSKEHRCPHMGCRLEWNPEEQTWECPCHGSRFDSMGRLKDNPAQIDLSGK